MTRLLLVLVFAGPASVQSAPKNSCSKALTKISSHLQPLYTKSVELPLIETSRKQGILGICWAISFIRALEIDYLRRTGKVLNLSLTYTVAAHFLGQNKTAYNNFVEQGAVPSNFDDYFGSNPLFIPQSVYKPKIPYEHWNFMGKWLSKRERPMEIQQQILRKTYFGDLPKNFVYENQIYTPKSFAQIYLFDGQHFIFERSLTMGQTEYSKLLFQLSDRKIMVRNPKVFSDLLMRLIDLDRPAVITFDSYPSMTDEKAGLIDLPANSMANIANLEESKMKHAVVVVGYKMNRLSRKIEWKVINTWGNKSGIDGIYWMSDRYLQKYIQRVLAINIDNLD